VRSHCHLQLQISVEVLQTAPDDGLKNKAKCYIFNFHCQVVYGGTRNICGINYKTGMCHLKSIVFPLYKFNKAKEVWTGKLQHMRHRWWRSICLYCFYLFIVYFTMLSLIKAINYNVECKNKTNKRERKNRFLIKHLKGRGKIV